MTAVASSLETNERIGELFSIIADYYMQKSDAHRAKVYADAATTVANFGTPIESGKQARKEIRGIGESVAKDIDEYLTTGEIRRLKELEKEYPGRKAVIDLFKSFHGIGPKTASKFYDTGYRTLEDLWFDAPISQATRDYIYYRNHFLERIPRSEMDIINERIGEVMRKIDPTLKWMIAGSYRRGEPTSGDIDLLVQGKGKIDLHAIVDELHKEGLLVADLAGGERPKKTKGKEKVPVKYLGIFRLNDEYPAHRFDIQLQSEEEWPYAVLYFTGSKQFNVLSRQRAIDLGYRLNEHDLKDEEGNKIPAKSEADIFRILGIKYLEPEQRSRYMTELQLVK